MFNNMRLLSYCRNIRNNFNAFSKKSFQMKLFIKILIISISAGISYYSTGCEEVRSPLVRTSLISNISDSHATCEGVILDEGSSGILASGIRWSSDSTFSMAMNVTNVGAISGRFLNELDNLTKGTKYYVRAYATNKSGIGYGDIVSFTTQSHITALTTNPATDISETGATLNGSIPAVNSSLITAFEYGQTGSYSNLIIQPQNSATDNQLHVKVHLSNLITGTTYHYRIIEISSSDTIFGNEQKFTTVFSDADGNHYNILPIGGQVWMGENLKTTRYNNGDLIITTSPYDLDISNDDRPEYQWPGKDANAGRYYTYYVVTDSRKICPAGWHVPSDEEWVFFTNYLSNNGYGYNGNVNSIAKSLATTTGWQDDDTPGNVGNDKLSNNSSGFSGFPSGGRYSNGVINYYGVHGIWWSDTESTPVSAYFRCIGYLPGLVFRGTFNKSYGLPVRCVRDN